MCVCVCVSCMLSSYGEKWFKKLPKKNADTGRMSSHQNTFSMFRGPDLNVTANKLTADSISQKKDKKIASSSIDPFNLEKWQLALEP